MAIYCFSRLIPPTIFGIITQLQGLGFSTTSKYYAIKNLDEASAYLAHPVLGTRLAQISDVLVNLSNDNATFIFGNPDDMKLKSCMTFFFGTIRRNYI